MLKSLKPLPAQAPPPLPPEKLGVREKKSVMWAGVEMESILSSPLNITEMSRKWTCPVLGHKPMSATCSRVWITYYEDTI